MTKIVAFCVVAGLAATLQGCGETSPAPSPAPSVKLHIPVKEIAPGVNIPVLSIGSGGLESKESATIVSNWMQLGGRGVDTAFDYHDQEIVAKAIKNAGVTRKDIFITTKIPGCVNAEYYVESNLKQLGTDYIDLLLIHNPICSAFNFENCSALASKWNCSATWDVLKSYHSRGVLKAIGVSNFQRKHLEPLLSSTNVVPAVNQVQLNVLEHDDDTIEFSKAHNITIEAYSPVGRGNHSGDIAGNPVIQRIAEAHNVSTYQVALKWILQHGHIITFQSTSQAHQQEDADLFTFNLGDSEMQSLDGLQFDPVAYYVV
jgi:diketogulonate reductase-like aldo/keto reductase